MGTTQLKINILETEYEINAYVIKGLTCEFLLGNNFCLKYNLVIDFDNKTINFKTGDSINMDKIWVEYNGVTNIEKEKERENIVGKIIVTQDILIPPKVITNIQIKTDIKIDNEQMIINPVNRLSQKHYLKLETNILKKNETTIPIYNFSNLYTKIYEGTVIGEIQQNTNVFTINKLPNEITDKQGTVIQISNDLTKEQKAKALILISKYKHLFTSDQLDLNCAKVEECEVKLSSENPIFQAPYRVSPAQREKLRLLIDEMIRADIIEPSKSNYAAPVFLIPKKQKGEYRFLVDFRKLNEHTISDRHPIPRAQDIFRALEGAKYFSTIDMAQGYFQIPVKQEDRSKLAFTTDFGLFQFKRIPQGWKNSAPIFQRIINQTFSEYLYRSIVAYLDDICCFADEFEKALHNLEQMFIRLNETGLKLKTNKCHFFQSEIELLGQKISRNGLKPLERNIEAVKLFPKPIKIKDVRAFIGLCSYYRKYIKNFSKIANPLIEITKKDVGFKWEKEQEHAFEYLKQAITSAPVLAHFKDGREIFITTDASLEGLGGILEQEDENGKKHPIGYTSRKLKGGEKNFSTTELEMAAVVFVINYFREYLLGRTFTVFSDHSSLQYFKNMKNPSSRITKSIFKLIEYDFVIKHKPGSANLAADSLSRFPIHLTEIGKIDNNEKEMSIEILKTEQSKDEFCSNILKGLESIGSDKYKKKSRRYCVIDNVLYYKQWNKNELIKLIVIPKNLINTILKAYHESIFSGHFGITKTLAKLKLKYHWNNMIKDTTKFINSCVSCQLVKNPIGKTPGLLQPIPIDSGKPLQRLTFDYLGPLPPSHGKKYLIVATCNATKMAFAKAVANATGAETIKFLMELITSYGVPKYFCSDRGTHFKNKEVEETCKLLGITQVFSSAYHPQTNGMTELMNKIICNSLTHYVHKNQKDWVLYYKMIVFAYNTCPSSRLKVSPFYLLHGMEANQPIDNKIIPTSDNFKINDSLRKLQEIRKEIPEIIKKEQEKQKLDYDKTHRTITFEPGQQVLVKFHFQEPNKTKKLAHKYRGPFKVVEKISDVNYKIELILNGKQTTDIIHVQRLKPFSN